MDEPSEKINSDFHSLMRDATIRPPLSPLISPTSVYFSSDPSSISTEEESIWSLPPVPPPLPPPPNKPLAWIWQCHICKTRWPLGATRRCLLDGHYYCSGQSQPNLKRKLKGRSCSSEFDYIGWKEIGLWRRKLLTPIPTGRHCEFKCDFPSQCRYKAAGAAVPEPAKEAIAAAKSTDQTDNSRPVNTAATTLEDIVAKISGSLGNKEKKDMKTLSSEGYRSKEDEPEQQSKKKMRMEKDSSTQVQDPAKAQRATRSRTKNDVGEKEKGKDSSDESSMQQYIMPVIDFLHKKISPSHESEAGL